MYVKEETEEEKNMLSECQALRRTNWRVGGTSNRRSLTLFYTRSLGIVALHVYLGLRVKCRRIANSRTDRLCCWRRGRRAARCVPTGPICYTFLPSRATRYNSDFPSFPWYGMIYCGFPFVLYRYGIFNHTKVLFQMGQSYAAIHRGAGLPVVGLGQSEDS